MHNCHHAPANTFQKVIEFFPCDRLGLSGTPTRVDGRHPTMFATLGPIILAKTEEDSCNTVPLDVLIKRINGGDFVEFKMHKGEEIVDRVKMIANLTKCRYRNRQVAKLVRQRWLMGRSVVVFTERVAHAKWLVSLLEGLSVPCHIMLGGMNENEVLSRFESAKKHNIPIVTTIALNAEGTNFPKWDCGILASPVSNKHSLKQLVGRVKRKYPNKTRCEWIDIVDSDTPPLHRTFLAEREPFYRKHAENIEEE